MFDRTSFSVSVQLLGHARLFVTPWAVDCQAPFSMEFPRQECWSVLTFPPPGDLSYPGTELASLAFPALPGRFFTSVPPGKFNTVFLEKNDPKI